MHGSLETRVWRSNSEPLEVYSAKPKASAKMLTNNYGLDSSGSFKARRTSPPFAKRRATGKFNMVQEWLQEEEKSYLSRRTRESLTEEAFFRPSPQPQPAHSTSLGVPYDDLFNPYLAVFGLESMDGMESLISPDSPKFVDGDLKETALSLVQNCGLQVHTAGVAQAKPGVPVIQPEKPVFSRRAKRMGRRTLRSAGAIPDLSQHLPPSKLRTFSYADVEHTRKRAHSPPVSPHMSDASSGDSRKKGKAGAENCGSTGSSGFSFCDIAKDLVSRYGPPKIDAISSLLEAGFNIADAAWECATQRAFSSEANSENSSSTQVDHRYKACRVCTFNPPF